jgi:hypothetical protein
VVAGALVAVAPLSATAGVSPYGPDGPARRDRAAPVLELEPPAGGLQRLGLAPWPMRKRPGPGTLARRTHALPRPRHSRRPLERTIDGPPSAGGRVVGR